MGPSRIPRIRSQRMLPPDERSPRRIPGPPQSRPRRLRDRRDQSLRIPHGPRPDPRRTRHRRRPAKVGSAEPYVAMPIARTILRPLLYFLANLSLLAALILIPIWRASHTHPVHLARSYLLGPSMWATGEHLLAS